MPASPDLQAERRDAIVAILRENSISTQSAVVRALREAGFAATQSSVSRDFRVLGVRKTPEGYRLPDQEQTPAQDQLAAVAAFVHELRAAGPHLIVLKTDIGAAQTVALALDRSGLPEIVGTVSGDDTILLASASAVDSRNIIRRLNFLFGLQP